MTDIWIGDPNSLHQASRGRRLSTESESVALLISAFNQDAKTAGRLSNLSLEDSPEPTSSIFLSGIWYETDTSVLIKLDTNPWENHWMSELSERSPELVPHVFAVGDAIGPYDLRWLIIEKVSYSLYPDLWSKFDSTADDSWRDRRFDILAETAVRFQVVACSMDLRFVGMECAHTTQRWLELGLTEGCPGPLERVLERLQEDWDWVVTKCGLAVCFGDLTPVNTLCRNVPSKDGSALLIDPIPRIAPWAWDGAYCQVICSDEDVGMIHRMASLRRKRGLHVPDDRDLDRVAAIMLAWMSALWWGIAPWRRENPIWREQVLWYVERAATT